MSIIPTVHAVNLGSQYSFGNIGGGDTPAVPELISRLMGPAFSVAALLVTFYFIIGAFKFMTSAGDKAKVGEAREMITHAIIGLILLLMMWLILRFIPEFFGLTIHPF